MGFREAGGKAGPRPLPKASGQAAEQGLGRREGAGWGETGGTERLGTSPVSKGKGWGAGKRRGRS